MQTHRILMETPSVQKIQSTMTGVIEHFKKKGYVSANSKLVRSLEADKFELLEHAQSELGKPYDFSLYATKQTGSGNPVQKLASYKQFSGNENYSMVRDDFNEKGQHIRHIFDEGDSQYVNKSLTEYEYAGEKLAKENEFGTYRGVSYNEVKIYDPETGYYKREMRILDNPKVKDIEFYNDKAQLLQKTRVEKLENGEELTSLEKFDSKTGDLIGMERDLVKGIKNPIHTVNKIEIDPKTDRILKYESLNNGKIERMFERDVTGKLLHAIDANGNEYIRDLATGKETLTSKTGVVKEVSNGTISAGIFNKLKQSLDLEMGTQKYC